MGRHKLYDNTPVPHRVWKIVETLSRLYDGKTETGLVGQINRACDKAMNLQSGDMIATDLFLDIVHRTGYWKSKVQYYYCRNSYSSMKRQLVRDIATELGLL